MILGAVIVIGSGYYFLHVKPINDLEKEVQRQEFILQKAKEKTIEQKIKNEGFEDKWKTIKKIKKDEEKGDENETTEDINISDKPGNYTITL